MTTTAVASSSSSPGLDVQEAQLLVPGVRSDPFPLRRIEPSPCRLACPAGINVKSYVSLIAEGRFADALEVIRERCPLPAVCGRVCHHPCEQVCRRGDHDSPIAIRALKRFVADIEPRVSPPERLPTPRRRGKAVAVIGSGPAGLTAAYDLGRAGYDVTVFEAEDQPGGMLRYGIAAYRLPDDVLDAEIEWIARSGIKVVTGKRLGVDLQLDELLGGEFQAVLLAVGAQTGRRLGLSGEEGHAEIQDALAFLRRVNAGDHSPLRGRVVVIGGGSTAVEAARTAVRLGAESVAVLYRRYREEMLASAEEIEAAEAEGVRFTFLVAPKQLVVESNRLQALECVKIGLGLPDRSGRRRPLEIPGSEFQVPADHLLAAVGQQTDLSFVPPEARARLAADHRLSVDSETAMSAAAGVFAAGDAVSGPATVIEAIAAGHRAAESIRNYLESGRAGVPPVRPERPSELEYEVVDATPAPAGRIEPPPADPSVRRTFEEAERAFTAEQAMAEARRCLRCGPCGECHLCAATCRQRHLVIGRPNGGASSWSETWTVRTSGPLGSALDAMQPTPAQFLTRRGNNGRPWIDGEVQLLPARVRVLDPLCRGCASCVSRCPFDALSMELGTTRDIVRVQSALCRGCNLCTAECPTGALVSPVWSAKWWSERLQQVQRFCTAASSPALPLVVLSCERRCGALEPIVSRESITAQVIRVRCTGQITAGMLLALRGHGARRVLVAGCEARRCRYGSGSREAAAELERASVMLRLLGDPGPFVLGDWSPGRPQDPLEDLLRKPMPKTRRPRAPA